MNVSQTTPKTENVVRLRIAIITSVVFSVLLYYCITTLWAATAVQPKDNGLMDHLDDVAKLILPLMGLCGSLILYAWHKMEKNIERAEKVMTDHIEADEDIHNSLFQLQRDSDAKLNKLIGSHNATHPTVKVE